MKDYYLGNVFKRNDMKPVEYVDIIKKTAVFPETVDNFGVAYSFLGMLDEYSELSQAFTEFVELQQRRKVNDDDRMVILAEAGDVIWYITAMANEVGVEYSEIFVRKPSGVDFYAFYEIVIQEIAGNVKKFYRDGKEIDKEKLAYILNYAYNCVAVIGEFCGVEMEDILQYNYDKLMKRRETNTIHGDGDYREQKQKDNEKQND